MIGKADLHTHTNYSDGSLTVYELLKKAKSKGLDCISITDHDTLKAFPESFEIANDLNIQIIPGLEISTEFESREVHILAYLIDVENEALQNYLTNFRYERIKRAKRIIERLNHFGIEISFDDVLESSNSNLIARTHIAKAMLKKQFVSSFKEAFEKFIGDHAIAYEKKLHLHPKNVINMINKAKGVSILAHPNNIPEHHLKFFIECGLDGIEVIHPSHSQKQSDYFRGIASTHFLLETGGSDYHGGLKNDDENFGKYVVSSEVIDSIKKRINNY